MDKNIKFYKSVIGEWLAIDSPDTGPERIYYSADGKKFFELYFGGFTSSDAEVTSYTVEYPHPGLNWTGVIEQTNLENYVLTSNMSASSPVFYPEEKPEDVEYFAIPLIMRLMGVYTLQSGEYVFWTESKYDPAFSVVRLYFGPIGNIKEYKVIMANLTGVLAEKGLLLDFAKRRFGGYSLVELDVNEFEIKVDGSNISLVNK